MGILSWFTTKLTRKTASWQEFGAYNATFTNFGANLYASDIVRSSVRPLADHTSKANAVCTDESIQRVLNLRPNLYMNGKEFLTKVRLRYELTNTVFIYIMRNDKGRAVGFYPVPYNRFEAVEYNGRLFITFHFNNAEDLTLPWADLAVLRRDYNSSDIAGDDNRALLPLLELVNTTNQGVANAVKATANLRGILKSTKAILSEVDVKAQKERFVRDYLNLENEGGIASLDATQEFTPITMSPTIASTDTIKEFRENIYRYFGVNDAIITNDYTEEQMEAFYDGKIEPFLVDLSQELTRKVFTEREIGYGAQIVYESNRIQYASTKTKLALVSLVDRGALTPNEWRSVFNLAPVEGGDVPIRRLDTDTVATEPTSDENGENEPLNAQEGANND